MPYLRALCLRALCPALLLAAAVPAAVGDWKSYSDYSIQTSLTLWHGDLFAGSGGGVRRINLRVPYPFQETDYNNMQGLVDVRIVAFATDEEDHLWAGSRSGQLFRLDGETWSAWGKSYASAGWTLNARALAAAGRYLILGSEQGLSLFDRKSGTAAISLSLFGTVGKQSVTSVLPAGDTLYIVAGGSVLYARFDWKDANSGKYGASVFDPAIWKPATNLGSLPDWAQQAATHDLVPGEDSGSDTLAARPVELSRLGGVLVAHDSGTLLDAPFRVKALRGRHNYVDGRTFGFLSKCEAAVAIDKNVFLAGRQGIFWYYDTAFLADLKPPGPVPSVVDKGASGRLAAVSSRGGTALIMSGFGIFRFGKGNHGEILNFGYPTPDQPIGEIRNLTMLEDGGFAYGSWGHGLVRVAPDGKVSTWSSANSCLTAVLKDDFTVISTISDVFGNDLWLTNLQNIQDLPVNNMAHLDLATNTLTCLDVKGDNTQTFATRVLTESMFAVAGDRTLRIYRYGIGGSKTAIEPYGLVTGGTGTDEGLDMQMDGYGRLWALMNGRIGYVDSLADKVGPNKKLELTFLDGFTGINCNMLETDALNGLWTGCLNGIYHLSPQSQPALTRVEHFTRNDGLLGDRIIDLSVDKQTGMVWATTEQGVNSFQSRAQPTLSSVKGVRAYPNPFRAKHRVLVIDNVPKGATGAIFTQAGDAVRRFEDHDRLGNQFQWDGKSGTGKPVTPGVYFYSVSAGGKTSQGKIIVAR
jgi:hypothetical protein